MSFFDDLRRDLPADPGSAVLIFAERVWDTMQAGAEGPSANEAILIIEFLKALDSRYDLELNLLNVSGSSIHDTLEMSLHRIFARRQSLLQRYAESEVERAIADFESLSGDETFGLARLNDEEKRRIHKNIEHIRSLLASSAISDRKKNALYSRLNDLVREVDALGTRTDRFFAFAGDVAFVLGDMATKAKPLLDEVREMIRTVGRSRSRQEGVALPPGDDPSLLPDMDGNAGESF